MEPTNTPTPVAPAPQAGTGQLEGPTSLFTSAWKLFAANWKILVLIGIMPTLAYIAGAILIVTIIGAIIGIPLVIFAMVLAIAMVPTIISTLHIAQTQPGTTFKVVDQYKSGFKVFWWFLLGILIYYLVGYGSMILLLIPGAIMIGYICMFLFPLVLEGKHGLTSFTESYSLVKGRWWGVFGRVLFMTIVVVAFAFVVDGISFLFVALKIPFIGGLLSFILSLCFSMVVGPLAITYMYRLYLSLKQTRAIEVPTKTFRKWLIVFMCLGPVAIVGFFALFFTLAGSIIKSMPTTPSSMTSVYHGPGVNSADYFPSGTPTSTQ